MWCDFNENVVRYRVSFNLPCFDFPPHLNFRASSVTAKVRQYSPVVIALAAKKSATQKTPKQVYTATLGPTIGSVFGDANQPLACVDFSIFLFILMQKQNMQAHNNDSTGT